MADYHLEGMTDEFFEQMLYMPGYASSSSGPSDHGGASSGAPFLEMGTRTTFPSSIFPLGLNLEQGKVSFFKPDNDSGSNINQFSYDPHRNSPSTVGTNSDVNPSKTDSVQTFGKIVASVRPTVPQSGQGVVAPQRFHGHPTNSGTMAHPPAVRSRPWARRGQATDPHSIAERLRRVRIAEKIKQLQELVPNCNKTDRAAMLDEIMDYIKFLRLQVNVLSMSRLGETGSVAQLLSGVSCLKVEGDDHGGTIKQQQEEVCDKWLADGTEQHVAKLMEEDVGAAMQFLQSKDLCLLPISLAMATFTTNHLADLPAASLKSETNSHT